MHLLNTAGLKIQSQFPFSVTRINKFRSCLLESIKTGNICFSNIVREKNNVSIKYFTFCISSGFLDLN